MAMISAPQRNRPAIIAQIFKVPRTSRALTRATPLAVCPAKAIPRVGGARQLLKQQFLRSHLVPFAAFFAWSSGATGIHGHQPPDEPGHDEDGYPSEQSFSSWRERAHDQRHVDEPPKRQLAQSGL